MSVTATDEILAVSLYESWARYRSTVGSFPPAYHEQTLAVRNHWRQKALDMIRESLSQK